MNAEAAIPRMNAVKESSPEAGSCITNVSPRVSFVMSWSELLFAFLVVFFVVEVGVVHHRLDRRGVLRRVSQRLEVLLVVLLVDLARAQVALHRAAIQVLDVDVLCHVRPS